MKHIPLPVTVLLLALALTLPMLAIPGVPAQAQDSPYPLPAPLYILTSDGTLLHIDPANGAQTQLSNPNQPVADFDVAPDGSWIVFRTANEGAVIVSQINGQSGYVLEFESVAPPGGPAQTIAWSPDALAIAYIIPEGVRIAYPGAGPYGEAKMGVIQGNWSELYWESIDTLIVSDETGSAARISGAYQQWTITPAADVPARPQPPIPSYLSGEGVILGTQGTVPNTAGTVAFDWGPLPPTETAGYTLPANLYFIAADQSGRDQVWQLPANGGFPQQITNDTDPVTAYNVSPDEGRVAYVAGDTLIVQESSGALQQIAAVQLENGTSAPQWSPDGTQIAFHDSTGIWVALADGTQSPQLVAQSTPFNEQSSPGDVRFYSNPRWSPDGTQLLVTVGLWESAIPGVIDLATTTITEFPGIITAIGTWTDDGRILAWSSFYAYSEPGLFLIDPAQPDAQPTPLIEAMAVYDAVPGPDNSWYALVNEAVQMGPHFMRVWQSTALGSAFSPVFPAQAGGFGEHAQLVTNGTQFMIAVVRPQTPEDYTNASGPLHLIDVGLNTTLRLAAPPRVHDLQWGSVQP